ncbi:hypothetical protein IGS59_22760 [Janthinobacterium sp. GW460P]|uniref:hypothetical protein n=1 Tax=unclassified Janthinobacterium TaxID=2610881 RepID=UPI000A327234|nr:MULTISPECIES: hypothetical protein [unclassified Janthinobacterium]MCC7705069.1 hypothetical protein [Janthinobacterium sp. GW460P]MCC7710571.1 hypothetical protein [Janthinobacterium sp. GW460W]
MQAHPDHPSLRLRTLIDAAALERMAPELEALFHARLLANRVRGGVEQRLQASQRQMQQAFAQSPRLHAVMVWGSVMGLAIAMAFAASGGLLVHGYRLDMACIALFGAILALLVLLPRVIVWQQQPWEWLWRSLARRLVARQLKNARALAPFEAQYDIDGRTVTYTRITPASATVRWTRTLAEPGTFGNGYTVFFEPAPSMHCVLLLHAPDARFEALWAQCPPPR